MSGFALFLTSVVISLSFYVCYYILHLDERHIPCKFDIWIPRLAYLRETPRCQVVAGIRLREVA